MHSQQDKAFVLHGHWEDPTDDPGLQRQVDRAVSHRNNSHGRAGCQPQAKSSRFSSVPC